MKGGIHSSIRRSSKLCSFGINLFKHLNSFFYNVRLRRALRFNWKTFCAIRLKLYTNRINRAKDVSNNDEGTTLIPVEMRNRKQSIREIGSNATFCHWICTFLTNLGCRIFIFFFDQIRINGIESIINLIRFPKEPNSNNNLFFQCKIIASKVSKSEQTKRIIHSEIEYVYANELRPMITHANGLHHDNDTKCANMKKKLILHITNVN